MAEKPSTTAKPAEPSTTAALAATAEKPPETTAEKKDVPLYRVVTNRNLQVGDVSLNGQKFGPFYQGKRSTPIPAHVVELLKGAGYVSDDGVSPA